MLSNFLILFHISIHIVMIYEQINKIKVLNTTLHNKKAT